MNIIGAENEDLGKVYWHLPQAVKTRLDSLPDTLQQNFITIATISLERYCVLLAGLYATVPESTDLVSAVCRRTIALEKEMMESLRKL